MTYSDFKSHLANALDCVNESRTPILVTQQSGKAVVVISLEDFRSYEETAHLMSNFKNAERLNQTIEELGNKGGQVKNLREE